MKALRRAHRFLRRLVRLLFALLVRSRRHYQPLSPPPPPTASAAAEDPPPPPSPPDPDRDADADANADLVSLKISLLGDCRIGKTSFMIKYAGGDDGEEQRGLHLTGLNLMDKVLVVRGVRIGFTIWDVAGDSRFLDHVPIACKDAAAILYMFDLTSRCTLNNVVEWYQRGRRWNETAISILIGTKFDDFVQLPLEMQWTIINQARAYARAMKATLFFSSATHK
uniref:Septum-promoting GTP-binding protein 1 n=1 Tax=Ananas comosus var. bracteatus TaxID=296719 RepID=A0A6V7NKW6_ANACO|nr:unnamed protein product [Ananas comosus var. bracteatus]